MTKCIVCDNTMLEHVPIQLNMHTLIQNMHETVLNTLNEDEMHCCELCGIAMCANGNDYIWDGVNLLVFDKKDGEYHERMGNRYKPTSTCRIVFEKDETINKWVVMPK